MYVDCGVDIDDGSAVPPIEEEAQFEQKNTSSTQDTNTNPRISTESSSSMTSNIIDPISRISLSSETSQHSDSHPVRVPHASVDKFRMAHVQTSRRMERTSIFWRPESQH